MPSKLGQNFLWNKDIVKRIVKLANLMPDDVVLEIGPGKGILTEELAKKARKVVAVELDEKLADYLKAKFKDVKNVEVIEKDILKTDIKEIIARCGSQVSGYKIVANIPYYITSLIIRYFLEKDFPPKEMILMIQKEVAERIIAGPGKHSILSLAVQYYANPELLFEVEKDNFNPIPEVDSAVIRITHKMKNMRKGEVDNFFRVVRAGFCAKRKTLANNLANSFHLDRKEVEERLKKNGIKPNIRAQELDIEGWKEVSYLFL